MAFTTSASESMATQMFGNITQICSIFCHSQLLLRVKFSAYMEDFPQILTPSSKLDKSIDKLKFPTRALCAISFGRTQMTAMVGVYLQGVLDLLSDKTYLKISITPIILNWYLELISWLWTGTTGVMIRQLWLFSQRQIIATDVETKLV